MLGDGRLRQPEVLGELADAVLAAAQVRQDRQAGGVGQDGQDGGQGGGVVNGGGVVGAVSGKDLMNDRHKTMISAIDDEMSRGVTIPPAAPAPGGVGGASRRGWVGVEIVA